MRASLQPGLVGTYRYPVGSDRTVPALVPDAPDFQLMPAVLATGYMVALCEWAAIELIKPHLDWPREQSLGIHVNLSHVAPTPPGFTLQVRAELTRVEGRTLSFAIRAQDDCDLIAEGTHQRAVIDVGRFDARLTAKVARRKVG
jgi:fluoroacetyl-CoA thioesterase